MSATRADRTEHITFPSGRTATRGGCVFDSNEERWVLDEDVRRFYFNFSRLAAPPRISLAIKRVILWYVENMAVCTAANHLRRIAEFLAVLANLSHTLGDEIGVSEVLSYRSTLSKSKMWKLGTISLVLRKWHALGIPGVSREAAALLEDLRIPGMVKGIAVRTMDPVYGPLIDIEYESVLIGLHDRHERGLIPLADYVLALLIISLGQRPLQYAALKVKDFIVTLDGGGSKVFMLSVPRAKQRLRLMRESFSARLLYPALGDLVEKHVTATCLEFENKFESIGEAPLFPARGANKMPRGFAYHESPNSLNLRLRRIVGALRLLSARTGRQLKITSYRFRRTVGTRAAAEGCSELVIAEMLDHSDTQNVGVYVEAMPTFFERIDRTVAFQLAPLARAFMGEFVERRDRKMPSGSGEEIWSPQFSEPGKSMGNCAETGPCAALVPIACYTCRRFRPFVDGPHDEVLNHLLAERDALMKKNSRVASILDRSILAVAQVVQECRNRRSAIP